MDAGKTLEYLVKQKSVEIEMLNWYHKDLTKMESKVARGVKLNQYDSIYEQQQEIKRKRDNIEILDDLISYLSSKVEVKG